MGLSIRGRRTFAGLLTAALCAYAFCSGVSAQAAVYWGSARDGVGAANLDGSDPQAEYFYWPFVSESQGPACGVAVNSEYLYWAAPGGIGRRKLDGEGIYPGTVVPHLQGPCGLALDESHLYWGNSATSSIGRANLDGSEANSSFVTGLERPCDVAVSDGHLFWIERSSAGRQGGVGKANLDGSSPQRSFIPFPSYNPSCGLAISGGFIYWGQEEAIARANLEGGEVNETFIPGAGVVNGIAIEGGRIYWVSQWPGMAADIGRANLDGSEADPAWIANSETELGGVAVDERLTAPYLELPSIPVRFAKNVQYNLRSGAILLGVYVPPHGVLAAHLPPQGQLTVTSPGLSWKVFGSTDLLPAQGGDALWQVLVRSGSGAVGRRIRGQLRRRGWAPVTVHLTYTQERVYPVEATRRVILRRYRGARSGWVKHPGPPRSS